ncbi:MAG TPA: hypothetical protein DF698_01680 [Candidatus Atribacteria bacterium]|nr:hypothetical protein [Candidatus Atribacteria bacterium]
MKVSVATAAYYTAKELGLTALLAGAGTSLTSCIGVENEGGKTAIAGGFGTLVPPDEFEETVTPKVELPTSVPTSTEIPSTPTPDPIPTLIPESYPRESSKFKPLIDSKYKDLDLVEGLRAQSLDSQKRLSELGWDGEIDAIKELFIEEETRRTGFSREEVTQNLEWEYYLNEGKYWLVIPRDRESGHYLFPVISNESCEGIRRKIDLNLATTLGKPGCEGDYFDLENLEPAGGLGETRQVVFSDSSGWFVFGEASNSTKEGYAWYNMKKEREKSWTAFKNFSPENATSVNRVEIENEGTGVKVISWIATNGKPGVEWQFDPQIQDWKLDVLKLLAEAGIEYPDATSSHFEADYGEFNFRIPKDLSKQIGKPYIQIPQDLLEKMYLHAMGRYMLFCRNADPERYSEFFDIAESIKQDVIAGDLRQYEDWPEFRVAAKEVLEKDEAVLELKEGLWEARTNRESISRKFDVLNYNLVTKDKFDDAFKLLESSGLEFFGSTSAGTQGEWEEKGWCVFANASAIDVIFFVRRHESNNDSIVTPGANPYLFGGTTTLELLSAGFTDEWYFNGIERTYLGITESLQQHFWEMSDHKYIFVGGKLKPFIDGSNLRFHPEEINIYRHGKETFTP